VDAGLDRISLRKLIRSELPHPDVSVVPAISCRYSRVPLADTGLTRSGDNRSRKLTVRPEYVPILRPVDGAGTLTLESFAAGGGHVLEGVLRTADPTIWYPIIQGVACFLSGPMQPDFSEFSSRHALRQKKNELSRPKSAEQAKTNTTFSDKWRRFKQYGLEPEHKEFLFGWYCKKLGVPNLKSL